MADKQLYARGDAVDTPARLATVIVPNDTAILDPLPKALYVTATGNVTLRAVDSGVDLVLIAVPAFTLIPIRASLVKAATTATVVALA